MIEETRAVAGGPRMPKRPGPLRRLLDRLRRNARGRASPYTIGRYRVLRKIGEGGMGTVFEAEDEVLGRRVAIKRLKAVDHSARRRFWREARAVARLSHPNVCPLYEVGEDVSGPFLAMELLSGEPLSMRLRRKPMEAAEAVSLGTGMLAALQTIHAAGLVHRDLKPSNVYLTPYGPRLLDFGLVGSLKAQDAQLPASEAATPGSPISHSELTGGGVLIGTPGYMAPEQILGGDVDGRADLFATGAVLYEALAGARAFAGARVVEVLTATLHQEPPPLAAPLGRIDSVLRRSIAKTPEQRYATAQEMAEALHAASAAAASPAPHAREARSDATHLFAGRRSELAWLEQRLDATLAGSGGVVFVTGERGAGKTALVGELVRRVRAGAVPTTIVGGRCLERQGPGEAFQPFLDALGRLFASSRGREFAVDLVKTWAPTVGVLLPAALVPDPDGSLHRQTAGATQERMIREAGDFMEAATRLFPVVLLIEDLQWADAASVELLQHLGRRSARQRILFLCTCRASEVETLNPSLYHAMLELRTAGQGRELALGPLGVDDVLQWLERRFEGNDFAAGLAPPLHARSEGLPLYVRSLLELLAGRGDIAPGSDGFRLARPLEELDLEPSKDVKDLLRAHLATLPAAERELLAVASVFGKEFSSALARALAGGDELEVEERLQRLSRVHRALESLGEEDLPDGTLGTRYRFAHGLYRRVLYEDLVAPRRAELHRRAGELMLRCFGENAHTRAAEMAEHFERARDFARAARFRSLAGEHAARRFASAEAVEHYSAALGLIEKLPREEAQPLEVALLGRRASARQMRGRFDDCARDYEAMAGKARAAGLRNAQCEALSRLCTAHFFAQRLPEMESCAKQALQLAERQVSAHLIAEARARTALVLMVRGRLDEAAATFDAVITGARRSGSGGARQIGLSLRGFVHYWQGEYRAAEERLVEALVLCEERGDGFEAFLARMFTGLARANQGRISEALVDFENTIVLARRNDDLFWEPRLLNHLGWVHRELTVVEKARGYDTRALALARENREPWAPNVDALLNLCVDGVRTGDSEGAGALLGTVEAGIKASEWMRWMNDLRLEAVASEHHAARGAYDLAVERAERLARLARSLGARGYVCTAARLTGEAELARGADVGRPAARLQRALGALDQHPAPLESWKSQRVLGLLRRRLGDDAAAQRAFVAAAGDVRTIAGGVDDDVLRERFLSSAAVRQVLAEAGRP
jgi:tetratricopeptide (TPR) repeat protein